ncbi:MAG: hypothetical protein IT536_13115 [Hyphomicrobiales bacterium]|nr:hypothetical protein [Hyphomicrobiales bacterium]
MDEQVFFRSDAVIVTPSVARFGPVSYQVATITSVAVHHRPRLNPIATALVALAVALGIGAYFASTYQPDYALWIALAAPVALVIGVLWQRLRPVLEYRFVMRTAGQETETLTTFDRSHAFELKNAIENAFLIRGATYHEAAPVPLEGPAPPPDEGPGEGLHITRDWLVANPDLAPR